MSLECDIQVMFAWPIIIIIEINLKFNYRELLQ